MTDKNEENVDATLLGEIDKTQKKCLEITEDFNKRDRRTKVIFGAIVGLAFFLLIFQGITARQHLIDQLKNLTEVKDGFVLNDLPRADRIEKYRKFMIRIMDVYGFQYNPYFIKALSPTQQADYIDFTFRMAEEFGWNPYWVPAVHLLESCFNPNEWNKDSGINEKGIGQQCWPTAIYCQSLVKFMPDRYQALLKIDLHSPDDLYDWRNSTKATFILLWWLKRDFRDREEWFVSIYKWGGFLSRYWDDGKGAIPTEFTINGKKQKVITYYMTWKKISEAWSRGDIAAGKNVIEIYQAWEKQVMAEEVQFRSARGIIRTLRAELEEKKYLEEKLGQKYKEISVTVDDTIDKLNKLYGEASRQKSGEGIRAKLLQTKSIVKAMINKIESGKDIDWLPTIILFVFIVVAVATALLVIRRLVVKRRKK